MMIRNEIGSEFWDVPVAGESNTLFPESAQWYISGRSALKAIIKELSWAETAAVPSWCCESMIRPFIDAGIEVHFYPVYLKDGLVQEINTDADVLFQMDYFGYTGGYKVSHPCIIRDVTHSLFSTSYTDAKYYFGSLRKWCGVWTGGYAWSDHPLFMGQNDGSGYAVFRQKAMEQKNSCLHGYISDKKYLEIFEAAENLLDNTGIAAADERDISVAKIIDAGFIKSRRRDNAGILRNAFRKWLVFPELNDTDCPMFVPILVPNGKRDELRGYLIQNKIYCPVHWNVSKYHKTDKRTERLFDNELSLVCDQRYSDEDMYRMVEIIQSGRII